MKLTQVKEILRAQVIAGEEMLELEVRAGAGSDLMSDLLIGPTDGALLLTGLTNVQAIRTAVIAGMAAVVYVRGKRPPQEVIALARDHRLPLLTSPFSMFTACGRLFSNGLKGVERRPPQPEKV